MPLDNSCNQDVIESNNRHVALSQALCDNEDDPRIFSMTTPKVASRSLSRIFHPVTGVAPTSKRIVEDIDKTFECARITYTAGGVHVPGLASTTGHRKIKGNTGRAKVGGPRVKKACQFLAPQGDEEGKSVYCYSGIGDLHGDLKCLFEEADDIMKAPDDFFAKKLSSAGEGEA